VLSLRKFGTTESKTLHFFKLMAVPHPDGGSCARAPVRRFLVIYMFNFLRFRYLQHWQVY